jgi:SAM-dependent methyltransferase
LKAYEQDLAYIHDAGFSGYALGAAPGLLATLRRDGIRNGLVVDLGCGSGRWARELTDRGYRVLGIDISRAMIELARRRAPAAAFRTGSLLKASLPRCTAVTSLGECINYVFDPGAGGRGRQEFFRRVHGALEPGGILIFDFATPERVPAAPEKKWMAGRDWAVLVEVSGNARRRTLLREIICFRRMGPAWRRSQETHRLRLFEPDALAMELKRIGFEVTRLEGYGRFRLLPGTAALLGRKVTG